jgi:hypothetical protein
MSQPTEPAAPQTQQQVPKEQPNADLRSDEGKKGGTRIADSPAIVVATLAILSATLAAIILTSRAWQDQARSKVDANEARGKLARTMAARLTEAGRRAVAANPETAAALARAALFALKDGRLPPRDEVLKLRDAAALGRTTPLQITTFHSLSRTDTGINILPGTSSLPLFWGGGVTSFFAGTDTMALVFKQSPFTTLALDRKTGNAAAYTGLRTLWAHPGPAPEVLELVLTADGDYIRGSTATNQWSVVSSHGAPAPTQQVPATTRQAATLTKTPSPPPPPALGAPSQVLPTRVDPTGTYVAFVADDAVQVARLDSRHSTPRTIARKATALWLAPNARAGVTRTADEILEIAFPTGLDTTDLPFETPQTLRASIGVVDLAFSDNAMRIATVSRSEVAMLDLGTGVTDAGLPDISRAERTSFEVDEPDERENWVAVAISTKGERIGARRSDGLVAIWQASGGEPVFQRILTPYAPAVAFDPEVQSLLIIADPTGGSSKACGSGGSRGCLVELPLLGASGKPKEERLPHVREYLDALEPAISDLEEGVRHAREDNIDRAVRSFESASNYPGIPFLPNPSPEPPDRRFDEGAAREEAVRILVDSLVSTAHNAASQGDVPKFNKKLQRLSELADDPKWTSLHVKDSRDDV